MSEDGKGDGDGHGKPAPPVAEIVNLADLFVTDFQFEDHGEYARLICLTEAVANGMGTAPSELIPTTRLVMTPSGWMKLQEIVLTRLGYVKRGT